MTKKIKSRTAGIKFYQKTVRICLPILTFWRQNGLGASAKADSVRQNPHFRGPRERPFSQSIRQRHGGGSPCDQPFEPPAALSTAAVPAAAKRARPGHPVPWRRTVRATTSRRRAYPLTATDAHWARTSTIAPKSSFPWSRFFAAVSICRTVAVTGAGTSSCLASSRARFRSLSMWRR